MNTCLWKTFLASPLVLLLFGGCTEDNIVRCQKNQRVVDRSCVQCPPGTVNDFGDDANGADTTCEPIICEVNQYVSSHNCSPCPEGETNDAGDDASGENTSCDTSSCEGALGCVCDDQAPCAQGLACVDGKCTMMQSTCDATPGIEGCPCVDGGCAQGTSLLCWNNMCSLPKDCGQLGCVTNQKCQLPSNANEQGMCLQECEAGFVYDAQNQTCVEEMMPTKTAACPPSALSCDASNTNCVCMRRVLSSGGPATGADHEVVGNVTTSKTSMAGGEHSVVSN